MSETAPNLTKSIRAAKRSMNPDVVSLAVVCEMLMDEVRELRELVTPRRPSRESPYDLSVGRKGFRS